MLSRWHLNLDPDQPLQGFFQFFPLAAKVLEAFDTGKETNGDDVNAFVKRLKSPDADQDNRGAASTGRTQHRPTALAKLTFKTAEGRLSLREKCTHRP